MDFQQQQQLLSQQQQQQQQQQNAAQNQLKPKQNPFYQKGKPFVKKGRYLADISGTYLVVYDHYQLMKRIGDGAYGVVFKAMDKLKNNEFVAIKKVSDAFRDPRDAKRILREIKLLKFCDHPNIIKLKDIIKPEMPTNYKDIYLVLEFMEIDLDKTINSEQALSPRLIKNLMWQLLCGIYYMHSADIIHRDIKPSNILLNKNCTLKLADMNLARKFDVEQSSITEYVVTRPYRAPEILLSTENYSKPIDIWSAGCIFAEMMGRKTIFKGNSYVNQLDRIIAIMGKPDFDKLSYKVDENLKDYIKSFQEKQPENFYEIYKSHDPLAIDLLYKMLAFDPKERWTVEKCLNHSYFNEFDKSSVVACNQKFDWSFDEIQERNDLIQRAIYNESCEFHLDEPDALLEEVEQHYKQQQQIIQQKIAQHQAAGVPQMSMQFSKNLPNSSLPMNFNPNGNVPFFPPGRQPQQIPPHILLQMQNLQKNNLLQKQFTLPGAQLQMPLQKDFGNPFNAHHLAATLNQDKAKSESFPINSIQAAAAAVQQNPKFVPGLHNFAPGFHHLKLGQQELFKKPNLNNVNLVQPKPNQNEVNSSSPPKPDLNSDIVNGDQIKNIQKPNKQNENTDQKNSNSTKDAIANNKNGSSKENKMNKQNQDNAISTNVQTKENDKSSEEKENPEQKIKKQKSNQSDNSRSSDLIKANIHNSDELEQLPQIPEMRIKTLTFGPDQNSNDENSQE